MLRHAPAMTTSDSSRPQIPSEARESETSGEKKRGFAAMDRERLTEIARKGGRAAHAAGTAHRFTPDEAREAGRRGGFASHARRRVERERQSAAEDLLGGPPARH